MPRWDHPEDFHRLYVARNLVRFNNSVTEAALMVLAVSLAHGDPAASVLVLVTGFLATALTAWIAGSLVDGWDRRHVMAAVSLLEAALLLGFPVSRSLAEVAVLTFFLQGVATFFNPAYRSLLPEVVGPGRLLAANSRVHATGVALDVLGFSLAAALAARHHLAWAFLLNAGLLLAVAALVAGVRTTLPRSAPQPLRHMLREGWRAVRQSPAGGSLLLLMGLASFPIGAVNGVVVYLLPDHVHAPVADYGYLLAVQGACMSVTGWLLPKVAARIPRRHLVNGGFVLAGLNVAAMSQARTLAQLFALYAVNGVLNMAYLVPFLTWYQEAFPAPVRGRAVSTYQMITNGAFAVTTLLAGSIAAGLGVGATVAVSGLLFAAVGLVGYGLPGLRSTPRDLAPEASPSQT